MQELRNEDLLLRLNHDEKSFRMECVNALAAQAKTDRAVIPELWGMVERLIRVICRRYCRPEQSSHLFDFDDLCQSAYLGFLKAIDAYDPERGAFSNVLLFYVRQTCASVIGRRGKRDALYYANSLDAPASADDDSGNFTLGDTLTDRNAEEAFEDVDVEVYTAQLHAALDDCMARIPSSNADLLRTRYYDRITLDTIAAERGVSREGARQKIEKSLVLMRSSENLEQLLPFREREIIDESLEHSGLSFFKNNWFSSVEWAAERIMQGRLRNNVLEKIGVIARDGEQ